PTSEMGSASYHDLALPQADPVAQSWTFRAGSGTVQPSVRHPGPGSFRTLAAFQAHLATIDPDWRVDPEPARQGGPLARPIEVLGRTLHNRFACQPMEGWDGTAD